MLNWVKGKIIKWLAIDQVERQIAELYTLNSDLVNIGVDVHFKSPHMIYVFSKLNGGQIRHIEANFDNLKELNGFVKRVKDRYKAIDTIWDTPPMWERW